MRGYTLVELIVTLTVLGLLSMLAYSSFEKYMIRATRSAAEQFMIDIATREAEYLLDARTYANTIGTGGLNLPTPLKVASNYNVSITVSSGPPAGYLITAAPIGRQTQDGVLTLDDTGQKLPVGKW
jgi:type IV pilus assembly protein PilE